MRQHMQSMTTNCVIIDSKGTLTHILRLTFAVNVEDGVIPDCSEVGPAIAESPAFPGKAGMILIQLTV